MAKVVMITGSFPKHKCGVGDYSKILCEELVKENVEVHVITSDDTIGEVDGLIVHNKINDWSVSNMSKVVNMVKEINPDLVHIQYPTKGYGRKTMINILPMFLKAKGFKVVTTLHEYSDSSTLGQVRSWPNIMFSDRIVVVDPRYKEDINSNILFKNKNIEYVNIASNIPKSIINEAERAEKRNAIVKDSKKKIIGYFGFINEKKGMESILQSLKNLKDDNKLNSLFLILGELDKNNQYHKSILDMIDKLGLKEDIIVTGYLKDYEVADLLSLVDFVVLPFVDGVSPKNGSLLAAVQEGKKVITTKGQNLSDDIPGIVYIDKYSDVDQLTEKIYILQTTQETVGNGGANKFNWSHVAKEHVNIYNK